MRVILRSIMNMSNFLVDFMVEMTSFQFKSIRNTFHRGKVDKNEKPTSKSTPYIIQEISKCTCSYFQD